MKIKLFSFLLLDIFKGENQILFILNLELLLRLALQISQVKYASIKQAIIPNYLHFIGLLCLDIFLYVHLYSNNPIFYYPLG